LPEKKNKSAVTRFKPGQSGNPAGRPKGSRNKLGEQFLKKLEADFKRHGEEVIQAVRLEKPDVYLKVVAQIVPKQMTHTVSKGLEGLLRDINDARRIKNATAVEVISDPVRNGGVGGAAHLLPGGSSDASGGEVAEFRELPDGEAD
jgi:hypothetical protein